MSKLFAILTPLAAALGIALWLIGIPALAQSAPLPLDADSAQVFIDLGRSLVGEVGPALAVSILGAIMIAMSVLARYTVQILKHPWVQLKLKYQWDNLSTLRKMGIAVAVAFVLTFGSSFGTALVAGVALKIAVLAALKVSLAPTLIAFLSAMGVQGGAKALAPPAAGAPKP